jgi:hypothetical protein
MLNQHTEPSIHSRAARRATSPSLTGNVSQSLKDIQPPKRSSTTHIFSGPRDGGIRKKKGKQLKRGQLERQRRGVERADIVKGQLDAKLEKSLGKLKTMKERRKDWDVTNKVAEDGAVRGGMFGVLDQDGDVEGEWVDEEADVEKPEQLVPDLDMKMELPILSVGHPQAEASTAATSTPQDDDVVE